MMLRNAAAVVLALLISNTASALDGIDLSRPLPATTPGECPLLVKIKYPFLSCANGQIGQAEGNELWEDSRQIPRMSDWTESNGTWGPDLNQN